MNRVLFVFLLLITCITTSEAAMIQNAKVQRVGADIELSWEYDPGALIDQADIWMLSGKGIEFDKNPFRYNKVNSVKGTSYRDIQVKTGDGQNCYYRIVPQNTVQKDIFDGNLNDTTLGKYDLNIKKGLNLVALPLVPQNGNSLDDVIGEQLGKNDQIIYFDNKEKDFRRASYTSLGMWQYSKRFSILPGQGFFINAQKNGSITFAGLVTEELRPIIYEGNNLIGNSTPFTKEINRETFGGGSNGEDAIYNFNPCLKAVLYGETFTFSKEFLFMAGTGYWYQRSRPAKNHYPIGPWGKPSGLTFKIPAEGAAQFITANEPPDDFGDHISDGALIPNFNNFLGDTSGEVYLRIWNTQDISKSVKGKKYETYGPYSPLLSPSAPLVIEIPYVKLDNICLPPSAPGVRVEGLTVAPARITFTVVPIYSKDSSIEVASSPKKFRFKFRLLSSKSWDREYISDGPLTISGDTFFKPGMEYELAAQANNYFGPSQYDEKKFYRFRIPAY